MKGPADGKVDETIPEPRRPLFRDVSHAYLTQLRQTYEYPDPVVVPGRRERIAVSFSVQRPVQRLVLIPARRANVIFNLAEVLWYLANRNDLDYLAYYAPGIRRWSTDGRTMPGSAYGRRFFSYGAESVNQWETVVRTLKARPLATRAVMQVLDPAELLVDDGLDYACTLAFQFLAREGCLHCFVFMRANDAFLGAANDMFAFTFVQEMLARELGLEVGHYHHNVGSFHTIDSYNKRIEEVLADPWREETDGSPGASGNLSFPSMPPGDNWPAARLVLEYEESLRQDRLRLSCTDLETLPLHPYWRQVVALFELHRQLRHRTLVDRKVMRLLSPVLARAVAIRWPELADEVPWLSGRRPES